MRPSIVTEDPSQKKVSDKNSCDILGLTLTKIVAESDLHKPFDDETTSLYSVSTFGETLGLAELLLKDAPLIVVQEYL